MAVDAAGETLSVSVRVARPGDDRAIDVALDVPPGITALLGPSGSGKSTTLAAVAGLLRPSAGHVAMGRETWFDEDRSIDLAPHRRRVAFVFQSLALFPHLTAAENVAYGLDRAIPRASRARAAAAWLERFRVAHLARRKPPTFSGGEAQRVALARAFAIAPRAVLLDEPFSALDGPLRQSLALEASRLVRELGVPVLLVTHQRDEAKALCDRFVSLAAGKVVSAGPMAEIDAAPAPAGRAHAPSD